MKTQRSRVDNDNRRRLRELEKPVEPLSRKGGELAVHLLYPNSYWIGMSNLGFQAVYSLFSREQGVCVERGFLPDENSTGDKLWKTFENERALAECDLLGVSLSFETDYPHLLKLLRNAGLLFPNAGAREKAAYESKFSFPLIIAGGTAVTLNPEPIADFVDLIALGEAEEMVPELSSLLKKAKSEGWSRGQLLRAAAQIEGIYVPAFYHAEFNIDGTVARYRAVEGVPSRARRRYVEDLSKFPTYSRVLTPETEFKSMFLTETGRGCEMGCRFCVAGYIYRPVRKRSEESIADTVKIGLEHSDAVGFVGAAVSSHRSISKLARSVAEKGGRASLSSLMSQKISRELAASLSESEYKTVALAPEAGTERLRRAAGKRVSNEQVVEAARQLAEAGIRGFKLYYIVGLPTETDADVEGIALLSAAVRDAVVEASRGEGKPAWVVLSVNPFIPKASTPFQWEPMLQIKQLEAKIETLRRAVRKIPNLEMRFESPKESYFQALLSRGDRRVGRYLWRAEEQGKDWKWIMRDDHEDLRGEVPPISFYVERRFEYSELLPWEVVDSRIDKNLLRREALRAHHGEEFQLTEKSSRFEQQEAGVL